MYIYTENIRIFVANIQDNIIFNHMATEHNFYLQRMNTNNTSYPVKESVGEWKVWCKDITFKIFEKVKAPAKRTWYDEHGDDEYMPQEGLYIEAYTMKVEFSCKSQDIYDEQKRLIRTAREEVRLKVKAFLTYLRESGMMNMYSTHTGIGRQNVRLESVGNDSIWKQGDDGWWFLIFDATFKVNDPVTDITLTT